MVSNTANISHLLPATHCLYILYFGKGGGVGGGEQERRLEGR